MINVTPRAAKAIEANRNRLRDAVDPPPQEREPQERDTKPVVVAKLHNIRVVFGTKVYTQPQFAKQNKAIANQDKKDPANSRSIVGRVVSFLVAVTSKRLSGLAYGKRMATCRECPHRTVVIKKTIGITIRGRVIRKSRVVERWYCRACKCWQWSFAELKRKNWFSKSYCPKSLHDGPLPDDAVTDYIVKHGYATREQINASRTGCGSCGG